MLFEDAVKYVFGGKSAFQRDIGDLHIRRDEKPLRMILLSAEDILTLSDGDDLGGFDTPYDPF